MKEKVKSMNIIGLIIWLVVAIPMGFAQFVMIFLSVMMTDAGPIEVSLTNTIPAMIDSLIVASPSIIALITALILRKKKKILLIVPIISLLIVLFLVDLTMNTAGGYSINGFISDII